MTGLQDPPKYLQWVAAAYAYSALKAYLEIEGEVSFLSPDKYARSAEAVCGLARCLEHMLKLRLWQVDPALVFPAAKKHEDYLILKGVKLPGLGETKQAKRYAELTANTVTFGEALDVVRLLSEAADFPWDVFKGLYGLRNSLEHGCRPNETYLRHFFGGLSAQTLPALQRFIAEELHLENVILDPTLLKDVEVLDRAHEQSHSLAAQKRLEFYQKLWTGGLGAAPAEYQLPDKYPKLNEYETSVECLVCKNLMSALWDWEPDYDDEGPAGAYPDAKCLLCGTCGFFIDGRDVETYLPEGIPTEEVVDPDEYTD